MWILRCCHLEKKLKKHTKDNHNDMPEKFSSTTNKLIFNCFKKQPLKADEGSANSGEVQSNDNQVGEVALATSDIDPSEIEASPLVKSDAIESAETNFIHRPNNPNKIEIEPEPPVKKQRLANDVEPIPPVSKQIHHVISMVNKIHDHLFKNSSDGARKPSDSSVTSHTVTPRTDTSDLTMDELQDLISKTRSLDTILKLIESYKLEDNCVRCTCCAQTFEYDFDLGTSFYQSTQPPKFKWLKKSLARHIDSIKHKTCAIAQQKQDENSKKELVKAEKCALNCAEAAYSTYYFSHPYDSYEYQITNIFNSGGLVGNKNHSKNFADQFLLPMYDSVKSRFLSSLVTEDTPFGVLADKMTTRHRTRHLVGIRIPVFDARYSGISKDIFIQRSRWVFCW